MALNNRKITVLAQFILLLASLFNESDADLSGQNPPVDSCICLNVNSVVIRSSACGPAISIEDIGYCFRYLGRVVRCSSGGSDLYDFFHVAYPKSGSGDGWVAANYLIMGEGAGCADLDACISAPCLNGGTCEANRNGYQCTCPPGYPGQNCEGEAPPANQCESAPCRNGGTCNGDANGYTCLCMPGWTGRNCESATAVDYCACNPCRNGGTCVGQESGYVCNCAPGFGGTNCEEESCEILIQQHMSGSNFFDKLWVAMVQPQGVITGDYWAGLDAISQMTQTNRYKLRIDMTAINGTAYFEEYTTFTVGPAGGNYLMSWSGFTGNTGTIASLDHHNNMMFTTSDRDNDRYTGNCAAYYKGAFWHKDCFDNGINNSPSNNFYIYIPFPSRQVFLQSSKMTLICK